MVAIWNAPLEDQIHANNSVETALKMKDSVEEFNKSHPQYPEINIGVGVNSGEMVVGNVGGSARFDYTVLGDNVNLGSRLESLTKKYGVTVIVSGNTKDLITDSGIIFRQLDEVKVKGKDRPVKIFEPLRNFEANKDLVDKFEEAFKKYHKGDFVAAKKLLLKLDSDKASHKLLERVEELIQNPPENWNGVWKWDEK